MSAASEKAWRAHPSNRDAETLEDVAQILRDFALMERRYAAIARAKQLESCAAVVEKHLAERAQ